jgi:hypothetical protein
MKNGVKSLRRRLGSSAKHGLVTPLMRQPVTKLREAIRGGQDPSTHVFVATTLLHNIYWALKLLIQIVITPMSVQSEEIGWVQSQEIRWVLPQETGWVRWVGNRAASEGNSLDTRTGNPRLTRLARLRPCGSHAKSAARNNLGRQAWISDHRIRPQRSDAHEPRR